MSKANFKYYVDKVWIILLHGAWFFLIYSAFNSMHKATIAAHWTEVFVHVGAGMIYAFFAGIFFIRLYLQKVANRMVDFLLYPRNYLKKTPMSLSAIRGKISQQEYEAAEVELLELKLKFPESAQLNLLIFDLYLDNMHEPVKAAENALNFFRLEERKRESENLTLLLRCSDLLLQFQEFELNHELLNSEYQKNIYSAIERKSIAARIN